MRAAKWNKDHVRPDWNLDSFSESNETRSQHAHKVFYLKFVFLFCSRLSIWVLAELRTWGERGDRWIAWRIRGQLSYDWLNKELHFCDWLNRELDVAILASNQRCKNVIILNAVNSFAGVEVCQFPSKLSGVLRLSNCGITKCASRLPCATADVWGMKWNNVVASPWSTFYRPLPSPLVCVHV